MMPRSIPRTMSRDLKWGSGWVERRPRRDGTMTYVACWRGEGRNRYGKTFLIQEEAEDWLRALARARGTVTEADRRAVYDGHVVYFIQAVNGGPIKIGHAQNPAERLRTLQHSSPVPLRILAIIDGGLVREVALHREFADLRMHGEWFQPDELLLLWIAENATTILE